MMRVMWSRCRISNSADHGNPQAKHRWFLVGIRGDCYRTGVHALKTCFPEALPLRARTLLVHLFCPAQSLLPYSQLPSPPPPHPHSSHSPLKHAYFPNLLSSTSTSHPHPIYLSPSPHLIIHIPYIPLHYLSPYSRVGIAHAKVIIICCTDL